MGTGIAIARGIGYGLLGALMGTLVAITGAVIVDHIRIAKARKQRRQEIAARQQEADARAAYYQALIDAGAQRVRAGWWSIPGTKREEG